MSVELPSVTGGFGEEPTLAFPADTAPDGLQVSILEHGDGRDVQAGESIVVNYHGQIWGGEVFDSSFRRGAPIAFPIGVQQVIGGWDKGLVGQAIGSRVLLSIPPEHGYGSRGVPQAGIGGTDTLVFVVDIVGVQ